MMPVCEGGNSCLSVWPLPALSTSTDALCTKISGHGSTNGHTFGWKMAIESAVKSIAVVPDRFFDVTGRSYSID